MANLNEVIENPVVRKRVYRVFAAAGILIGAAQVGFASINAGQPQWLTATLAVYAFLGGVGFTVAQSNTDINTNPDSDTDTV